MEGYRLGLYEKAMPDELSLEEKLLLAKKIGFDYVEISIDETEEKISRLDFDKKRKNELHQFMTEQGIFFETMCLSAHRKYPLGSADRKVRKKSLDIMRKAIVFARDLGIRVIQLAGYDVYYEKGTRQTRKNFHMALRQCVEYASEFGIILAFETMETEFMNTIGKARQVVNKVNSPYLQVYPDIGNIYNATDDYLGDIKKVSDFLNNGGNLGKQLLYIASYGQEDTPNLDEFLSEYGLSVGKGVICESDSGKYYNSPCITVASTVSDNFTQDVSTENPAILSALCRPVNTLFDEQDMVSTDAYLKSSDSAYTANVDISQTTGQVNIGDALVKGQQNYMAVGSKAKFTDDNKTLYSNVIAVGSEGMLSDNYLQYSQYQNSEYFISVINGLTGKTAGITITPKTITGNVFDITQQQKTVLKWTFCLGVPVVVLIVGIVIWARRKNK